MKILQKKKILQILKERKWGTLMGVDGKKPYGVEVAYTLLGKYLYVIFNPAGRMARCFGKNKNAAFKICTADSDITSWEAVLVEGTMERVVDPASIKQAFRALSQKLGYDKNLYDKMAEKYAANPKHSPVHRILINIAGGKGSS
jgi:nitroimidazol reductase NimA-like FMN-containing flavoprotein (pyridoxamine 5'-phosphate oxidase superfamily)